MKPTEIVMIAIAIPSAYVLLAEEIPPQYVWTQQLAGILMVVVVCYGLFRFLQYLAKESDV